MAIVWGIVAGLFNGIGALFIFLKKSYTENELNRYLNIAAGIMLAAAFFSLLCPAYGRITMRYETYAAAFIFCGGVLSGYMLLELLDLVIPHLHDNGKEKQKSVMLFAWAIALHKIPEGLAMGVAYADDVAIGRALIVGIMLQNIPEGLAVAVSFLSVEYAKKYAVFMAFLTGIAQPVGMVFGLFSAAFGSTFVNFCMAFAGSALLFVIINEVLPLSYHVQRSLRNSWAFFVGFLLMSLIGILF